MSNNDRTCNYHYQLMKLSNNKMIIAKKKEKKKKPLQFFRWQQANIKQAYFFPNINCNFCCSQ